MTPSPLSNWKKTTLVEAIGGERRIIAGPFGSNLTQDDYSAEGVPVIRGANMNHRGRYIGGEFVFVTPQKASQLRSNLVSIGDIIVTQRGTVGQISIVPDSLSHREYIVSQSQMGIRLKGVEIDRDFLYFFLQSREFSKFVLRSTVQTGLPHINLGLLRSAPILLPPIFDQRSIAKILLLWDDAVERLTLQIGRKQQAFAYLREVLIHGARRLNHRKGSWPIVELGDVTGHLTDRNGTRFRRDSVMGVTKADGLVPMKEHVIADDIARYLIVPPMAFAYNPMRINIGSITMSEFEEDVIVSPDYVVFACNATRLLPSFLNHLRWTKAWSDFMTIAGNGSVRVRIYYASLADFEFHLPPLDEQRAIVGVLDDAEREVRALRAERAALEKQRDALATELLTGRLRVRDAARAALVG